MSPSVKGAAAFAMTSMNSSSSRRSAKDSASLLNVSSLRNEVLTDLAASFTEPLGLRNGEYRERLGDFLGDRGGGDERLLLFGER